MHASSMNEMRRLVTNYLSSDQPFRILDVGSYDVNGSYKPLFANPLWEYVGLDIEKGPNVDIVISDVYNWMEVEDESFDVVVSGQCLEHVEFPWKTMECIEKALKPGGLHFNIMPSAGPIHSYPLDTYRYNPDGAAALAKWAGLTVISVHRGNVQPWLDTVLVAKKEER